MERYNIYFILTVEKATEKIVNVALIFAKSRLKKDCDFRENRKRRLSFSFFPTICFSTFVSEQARCLFFPVNIVRRFSPFMSLQFPLSCSFFWQLNVPLSAWDDLFCNFREHLQRLYDEYFFLSRRSYCSILITKFQNLFFNENNR